MSRADPALQVPSSGGTGATQQGLCGLARDGQALGYLAVMPDVGRQLRQQPFEGHPVASLRRREEVLVNMQHRPSSL
jgi:hypothetical protein